MIQLNHKHVVNFYQGDNRTETKKLINPSWNLLAAMNKNILM